MGVGAQKLLRGRFEVLEAIGEGGFAKVFLARETTTGDKVALKVLKDGFQNDPEVIERFRREVFAVASINSPHVVGLKDFGISGDEFFIAMEFVEGPTLRDVLDQHQWSADSVHTIIGQIGSALEAAHAQDIVHRDLKPENVMLVSGPNDTMMVKVLDFGLAKLAELERQLGLAPLTRVGMCFGTPQYMSPDLIYGRPVDRSVDVFALAVMAYEMIGGRRPWDAATPQEVMVAVVKTSFASITRVHSSMTRRLEHINRFFQRALAKKKEDRTSDAAVFFRELSEALYGERRPLVLPSMRTASPELSAIHGQLPGRGDRDGETQLDMSPIDRRNEGSEKTIEQQAISGRTPEEERAFQKLQALNKSGRLSAAWIPSMPSGPSALDPVGSFGHGHTEETLLRGAPPPEHASVMRAYDGGGLTRAMPALERQRPKWLMPALITAVVMLLVGAAAIGFVLGRGR